MKNFALFSLYPLLAWFTESGQKFHKTGLQNKNTLWKVVLQSMMRDRGNRDWNVP